MGPLIFSLLATRIYKTKKTNKQKKNNLCYSISEISQKEKDKYIYLDSLILMNLKQSNP